MSRPTAPSPELPAGPAEAPERRSGARPEVAGLLVIAALVLAALNLRPAVSSIGPVLPTIRSDVGLSNAAAGLLTTIPLICYGLCAPVTPRVARRLGVERTIIVVLVLIGVATGLRLAGAAASVLFATTLVVGVSAAVTQTLLPAVVKRRFPTRAVLATGAYALSINLGALFAASLTAPLEEAFGSWESSLAVWAVLAPAAIACWIALARRSRASPASVAPVPPRLPWRSPEAWGLMVYFGLLTTIYIVALTWIAPLYQDEGFSQAKAGLMLSLYTGAQIVAGVAAPPLAHRLGGRRAWMAGAVAVATLGALAVAIAPMAAPAAWAVMLGLGMGWAYPLMLSLFVDRAATVEESGGLAAMGFCGGYLIAAVGPAGAGAVADVTGSLSAAFAALVGIGVVLMALTAVLVRR